MSLWTQGTTNEITKAAVEAFENDNNLGVDGEAGPAVWTALINDTINHKTDPVPYVYVVVNKVVPQNLTLYENGAAKYVGIPVNSGAPGRRHHRRLLRRLRARALLGHEGDQRRRLHLQRPQRALRQLLQRGRRPARLHPVLLRDAAEQRLRRDELRRRGPGLGPHPDRHPGHRRRAQLRDRSPADDDHHAPPRCRRPRRRWLPRRLHRRRRLPPRPCRPRRPLWEGRPRPVGPWPWWPPLLRWPWRAPLWSAPWSTSVRPPWA